VREEKDGGGKEESKGKSCCAPPETKSWLLHCYRLGCITGCFMFSGLLNASRCAAL